MVLNLNRIYASCSSTNRAAARVMQKVGMLYEATFRQEIITNDEPGDVDHYAILKSDDRTEPARTRLETDRLILRTPEYTDIVKIVEPINDKEISDNSAHIPFPFTETDAEKWYAHACWATRTWGHVTFVIELKATSELIGSIWLREDHHHKKTGIAYWIGKKYWNKGYATEACRRLIQHAFDDRGIERLTATVIIDNESSVRITEKLGMELESTTYKEWWRGDDPIDCHHYVAYKDKWESSI